MGSNLEIIRKTILVVDDVEMNRAFLKKIFSDKYSVIEAANGREAMHVLEDTKIDLVVVDIEMPIMGGFEVIEAIRSDERLEGIPIVVTTGEVERAERKALELGADEFIEQPYDPYIIRKRVDNLIQKYVLQVEQYKATADAEKKANRAKSDSLSRMSHDMRTPLNGILGLTRILQEYTQEERVQLGLSELELSGKYLLSLINDTLDVSKIESGRMELHPSVCDGQEFFNSAVSIIRTSTNEMGLTLNVDLKDNFQFGLIYTDVGRLEQVIMNIVGNAIKFSPKGSTIDLIVEEVSADQTHYTDKITITDHGKGISKEFLPHLFEPFSQEDDSGTGEYRGTGLGMTITKELVELMCGSIHVESTEGVGTTVELIFPFQRASEEQISEWKNGRSLSISDKILEGKRVLLCEDHPLNTKVATHLLENKGMIVDHAENGKLGLQMYSESKHNYYDVVLMDIRMPIMDGLEATRCIRELPRKDARFVPIIAMTADAFNVDVQKTRDAGMDAHLTKPIEPDKLYSTLKMFIRVAKSEKRQMILVVDDIELNRAVISAALDMDYEILEAKDGAEALKILEEKKGAVNAIVTDIQMPVMDGVELIKQIRSNDAYRRIAIIANTAYADQSQEERLLAMGANDFIYKPTTSKIVELRVRNALRRL